MKKLLLVGSLLLLVSCDHSDSLAKPTGILPGEKFELPDGTPCQFIYLSRSGVSDRVITYCEDSKITSTEVSCGKSCKEEQTTILHDKIRKLKREADKYDSLIEESTKALKEAQTRVE